MNKIDTFVTKGFIVPPGFVLVINGEDGGQMIKEAGSYSGSNYSFQDVYGGSVPNWELRQVELVQESYDPVPIDDELNSVLSGIQDAGGSVLFVGGVVRDKFMGRQNKDIDIEVYSLSPEKLSEVLSKHGKVDTVGASFGVIKLTTPNADYDFTLPRRENKQGSGHRGFVVEPDPDMTPEDAASRRDFTFNALAMTPEGKLLDFFNGLRDLNNKILRHTSDKFAEDPLRVLRGFQFAARFGLSIDHETAKLSKTLKKEYATLAKERIWGEWQKWAEKGKLPSAGLRVLQQTGWLEFYPELNELVGVPQSEKWHPEGDVWNHTLHVVDAAAEIADRDELNDKERLVLLFAALCHDLGKVKTTVFSEGEWRAPNHANEGELPTISLMDRLGAPKDVVDQVVPLVKEHMSHLNDITDKSIRRLSLRLVPSNIEMLARVIEADSSGRPPLPTGLPEKAKQMLYMAHQLHLQNQKQEPLLQGRHLLRLANEGKIPEEFKRGGAHFGELLNHMFEEQLDGAFETEYEAIEYIVDFFKEAGAAVFILSLSRAKKERIVERANEKGLTEKDLLSMSPDEIKGFLE